MLIAWAALLIIFAPALFSEKTFCLLDYSRHYYPLKAYAVSCLKAGLLPLWNPLIYCGYPQVGELQVNMFYPLNLLLLLGDFTRRLELFVFIHYLIASAAAYYLGRCLGLSRGASLALGAFYSLNGHLLLSHQAPPALCSLAYMPLVAALFYGFLRRGGRKLLLGGVLALALQITAGYPITVYQTLFGLCFLLVLVLLVERGRAPWLRAAWCLVGVIGACALAAAALLPFFELLALSERVGGRGLREMLPISVPPEAFSSLFSPVYFGAPASGLYHGPLRIAWVGAYYGGAVLLFLAGSGAVLSKRRASRYLLLLAGLALVLMLGDHLPLGSLRRAIPGLGAIKQTGTFFSLLLLCLATLGAIGFDEIRRRKSVNILFSYVLVMLMLLPVFTILNPVTHPLLARTVPMQYSIVICLLALGVILRKRRVLELVYGPFLIALLLADLFIAAPHHLRFAGEAAYRQGVVSPLPVFPGRYLADAQRLSSAWKVGAKSYDHLLRGARELGWPNLNILSGRYCASGYGSIVPRSHGEIFRHLKDGEHRFGAVARKGERTMPAEYFRENIFRGDKGLRLVRVSPGRIALETERDGRVVVKESWHPGWRLFRIAAATGAGAASVGLPCGEVDSLSGLIHFPVEKDAVYSLRFEPFSFKLGLFLSLLMMMSLTAFWLYMTRDIRRR